MRGDGLGGYGSDGLPSCCFSGKRDNTVKFLVVMLFSIITSTSWAEISASAMTKIEGANSTRITEWLYQCTHGPRVTVRDFQQKVVLENGAEELQLSVSHTNTERTDNPFIMRLELIRPGPSYGEEGLRVSFIGSRIVEFAYSWDIPRAHSRDRYHMSFDREKQHKIIRQFDVGDLFNKYKFLRGQLSHVNLQYGDASVMFADCDLVDAN